MKIRLILLMTLIIVIGASNIGLVNASIQNSDIILVDGDHSDVSLDAVLYDHYSIDQLIEVTHTLLKEEFCDNLVSEYQYVLIHPPDLMVLNKVYRHNKQIQNSSKGLLRKARDGLTKGVLFNVRA